LPIARISTSMPAQAGLISFSLSSSVMGVLSSIKTQHFSVNLSIG
jgi:hypothetical protein